MTEKFNSRTRASVEVDNKRTKGPQFDLLEDEDIVSAAAQDRTADAIDRLVDDVLDRASGVSPDLIDRFEELIASATSMEEVREIMAVRAGDLIAAMDFGALAALGERAGFGAKIAGLVEKPGR